MHRSILETTPRFGACWHPFPGAAGREALPAPAAAGPAGREAALLCPVAGSGGPLLPATSALLSHKRIPVIPLERQSLIIPHSLSDETPKLAPYRNSFPGAKRSWQHGGAGMCRPHQRPPVPRSRAGLAGLSPCTGGSGPRRALPTWAPAARGHLHSTASLSMGRSRPPRPAPRSLRAPPRPSAPHCRRPAVNA